jgi:hypothetical protein
MEDPRLDASVLLAELPIYKQEAQALIWLSYSVLGVRRDFDLRVESRRGRSYGTPPVAAREGLTELRISRPTGSRFEIRLFPRSDEFFACPGRGSFRQPSRR